MRPDALKTQAPYAVGGSVTASPGTGVKTQALYAVGGSVTADPGTRCQETRRTAQNGNVKELLVFFDVLVYTFEETFRTRCLAEVSALYG